MLPQIPLLWLARSPALSSLAVSLLLAGCVTTAPQLAPAQRPGIPMEDADAYSGEKFPVPPRDPARTRPENVRQLVDYRTHEQPGTLVVDTRNRFVYLVKEGGKALRYGVGVGREGLEFSGSAAVGAKREWPRWTPTPNMIRREPERYAQWAKGMEGGADNPLGARALYLYKDGRDTLFRIHGTNEPETIGQAVSSGCIRMMNQDVIDLYRRVPTGAKVVVL
ncbi:MULTISPECIES: L,D-transpeptidase [unclassified Chelatococcus]|uniref:L,D-transpeptidase n=1 Tax=unclassified Chelatococcus TaxID=2638111 RepID=UPI001BCD9D6A|nr:MULTISPECIES: L,D-transpeptidase [unclassified Chelatococcus]MBS7700076.1 L,D-transpeptidase [Chelatococcus sp. YT9]MBX3556769.1 L,D-transpeptidase [Chelatococcus sp.]